MCIHPSSSNLVSSGFWKIGSAESGEKRPYDHYRSSQGSTFADKILTENIVFVDAVCAETKCPFPLGCDFHSHILKQADQIADVQNIGDIGYAHFFFCQKSGADDFQRFVLGSLRGYFSLQRVSAFDNETAHC